MNRGFKTYFNESRLTAKNTLKTKGTKWRFYQFFLMNVLSIPLFIFRPIFVLANIRMAKIANEEHDYSLTKCFNAASFPRKIWIYLILGTLKCFIFLSGVILIALITALFGAAGFGLGYIVNMPQPMILAAFTMLPCAIGLIIYLIGYMFYFNASNFIVEFEDNPSVSDALFKSIEAYKKDGKRTYFALVFVPILLMTLYLIGASIISYVVYYILYNVDIYLAIVVLALVALVFLIQFFLNILPRTVIGLNVSLYYLNNDLIYNNYKTANNVNGLNVKKFKANKKFIASKEVRLADLFDDTDSMNRTIQTVEAKEGKVKPIESLKDQVETSTAIEAKVEVEQAPVVEETKAEAEQAHVVEETKVEAEQAPVVEETKVEEEQAPVVEETKAEEEQAPVAEETKAEEEQAPVAEETKAEEEQAPVVEETKVEAEQAPVVEETKAEAEQAPVVEETKTEEQAPVVEETKAEAEQAPVVEEIKAEVEEVAVEDNKKLKKAAKKSKGK